MSKLAGQNMASAVRLGQNVPLNLVLSVRPLQMQRVILAKIATKSLEKLACFWRAKIDDIFAQIGEGRAASIGLEKLYPDIASSKKRMTGMEQRPRRCR